MSIEKFMPATADSLNVDDMLKGLLEQRALDGVVDLKVTAGRSSSTREKRWVIANVLRLKEEGRLEEGRLPKSV